ncbi:AAA family ATPase [Yersinia enterocolitica]
MGFLINKVALNNGIFEFTPLGSDTEKNIFTILIGKNGSGKSRLLSSIAHLFCSINVGQSSIRRDHYAFRKNSSRPDNFECSYYKDGMSSLIRVFDRKIAGSPIFNKKNQRSYLSPDSLICISTSPFDRFPTEREYYSELKKTVNEEFYYYYGIKDRGVGNPLVILIEKIIFRLASKPGFQQKTAFVKALSFLNYQPKMKAVFRLRIPMVNLIENMHQLGEMEFLSYLKSISKSNRPYYNISFDYSSVRDAIEYLYGEVFLANRNRYLDITIDYSDDYFIGISDELVSKVKVLSDINILTLHDIILYPNDKKDTYQNYNGEYEPGRSLYDASSGEQCILLSTLSIASSIKNNSLILIDEPEISLHPEWQETYIDLLMNIFGNHNGCHFIIATHSPQIISRLNDENCYITQTESGEVASSTEYIHKSADFQLVRLFKTPGKENEYLKRLAVNVLTKISKGVHLDSNSMRDIEILMAAYAKLDSTDTVKSLIDLIIKVNGIKK